MTACSRRSQPKTIFRRSLSSRGGELWCEVKGERVILKGNAVLTLRGELLI
jgi:hypothetical protein